MNDPFVFQVSSPIPSKKNNRVVMKSGINIPSKEFRAWHKAHIHVLKAQQRKHGTFSCPVTITLGLSFRDLHRRDLDNALTSVMDLVKDSGLIVDDDWGHVPKVVSEAVNFGEDYAIVSISPYTMQPWWKRILRRIFK